MKNLHLILTDKPSVLILRQDRTLFFTGYGGQLGKIHGLRKDVPQNIYITNSEEIKEGDWFIREGSIHKCFKVHKTDIEFLTSIDSVYCGSNTFWSKEYCKKIILTTDQDLIGVQPIDDEFLEWFVKNPSCEMVEVEDTCLEVRVCDCAMNENCLKPGYTIIIPQEEPKQELNLNCFDCNKSLQDCTCIEDTINMKKETLEEVADNWVRQPIIGTKRESFIAGYKLAQERMYSEEEMLLVLNIGFTSTDETWEECVAFAKEQFKKK